MTDPTETTAPRFPYPSFQTLLNQLERMEGEASIPPRIDRSFLSGSEGTKTQIMVAMKVFGLINQSGAPTDRLTELVNNPKQRPSLIRRIVEEFYPKQIELGQNKASQSHLEEAFEPLTGSTRRKAVAFYLKAAKYAGLPVSPNFKTPRERGRPKGAKTRRRKSGGGDGLASETTPTPAQSGQQEQRARYIDLLIKKAETDQELDDNLLNRIEFLLGFRDTEDDDGDADTE